MLFLSKHAYSMTFVTSFWKRHSCFAQISPLLGRLVCSSWYVQNVSFKGRFCLKMYVAVCGFLNSHILDATVGRLATATVRKTAVQINQGGKITTSRTQLHRNLSKSLPCT